MIIDIRLTENEKRLADSYAKMHSMSIGEAFKKALFEKTECRECAADHRQLAEWLMELKDLRAEQNDQYVFIHELMSELKEAKRLLKLAVEDFETIESNLEYNEHCVIKTHSIRCDECPLSATTIYRCKWRHADEALKLMGDEPNGI
jgi:hypothetical protein